MRQGTVVGVAGERKRRIGEHEAHGLRHVVVAGQAVDGLGQAAENVVEVAVPGGIVLYEIAGQQGGVPLADPRADFGHGRAQRVQGRDAAQPSGGIAEQVRVGELHQPHGLRR